MKFLVVVTPPSIYQFYFLICWENRVSFAKTNLNYQNFGIFLNFSFGFFTGHSVLRGNPIRFTPMGLGWYGLKKIWESNWIGKTDSYSIRKVQQNQIKKEEQRKISDAGNSAHVSEKTLLYMSFWHCNGAFSGRNIGWYAKGLYIYVDYWQYICFRTGIHVTEPYKEGPRRHRT